MIVVENHFKDILKPWTKDYFYSIGLGEFWERTRTIGEKVLQEQEDEGSNIF